MSEKGFEPLTSQLGIAGTSYRLQIGFINDKWASRLLKGKDVIDVYIYKEQDLAETGQPNLNYVIGWVLRTVMLPNINPYQIQKTAQVLMNQALKKKDQRKVVASVEEAKDVELEKVPESEIKRPKAQGWVKEDGEKTKEEDLEEKRQAFKERVKERQEAQQASEVQKEGGAEVEQQPAKTIKTTRKLPSIPSAETSAEPAKAVEPPKEEVEKKPAEASNFCPSCGKDLTWKYCPYCGKPLPQ